MFYNTRGNANLLSNSSGTGLYSSSGEIRVTVVNGTTRTGLYASDGSWNVVIVASSDPFIGLYHPCGALRIVPTATAVGLLSPTGAWFADDSKVSPLSSLVERDGDFIRDRFGQYVLNIPQA